MQAIVNGRLLLPDGELHGKCLVFSDKILGVCDAPPAGCDLIDAGGLYVSPGFVDVHITQTVPDLQVAWEKALGTKLCYTEPDEVIDTALKTITGTDRLILWPAQ